MAEIKVNETHTPVSAINVPIVYSNGFITNVGASDISIIFLLDGNPAIKLHMSFTATKTIANSLRDIVEVLEKATSHPIMMSQEVEAGLKKMSDRG
jgi:hypothetical protein